MPYLGPHCACVVGRVQLRRQNGDRFVPKVLLGAKSVSGRHSATKQARTAMDKEEEGGRGAKKARQRETWQEESHKAGREAARRNGEGAETASGERSQGDDEEGRR